MDRLLQLYAAHFGAQPLTTETLPVSGSHRSYYRLGGPDGTVIGAIGTDPDENRAFITLSRHFHAKGLPVPEVLAVSADDLRYLQEDLGTESLYDALASARQTGFYDEKQYALLLSTILELPRLQFEGAEGLDWSVCYPEPEFNERMILFDLNYFKYCFLKATGLEFNEVTLQEDFEKLKDDLMQDMGDTFMYRDFQARNVMIKDGEPYFIDFQGGRRGPIYYDVASFAWQARAHYPEKLRKEMIQAYISALKGYTEVDESHFYERLRLFVLFRTLQVLGAYGFRGYFEKKPHFLASVPYALANLRRLLQKPFSDYPYLNQVLTNLATLPRFNSIAEDKRLEVSIYSFAYKKGIPVDTSGNGGGYVFDCRAINNPGKFEHYRQFTGMDDEVIKFLEDDGGVVKFLDSVYSMVDNHVKVFIERKFTHLQVCFGCTGGQHRSVYCAEHLARHLAEKFDIKITVLHRELDIEKIL